MPAAVATAPQDALKLLFLVMVGGGLLALGRWSSRVGGAGGTTPPASPFGPPDLTLHGDAIPKAWPPSAEEVAASLPFEPALGRIQIKRLYFDKTDAIPGPADPEVFAEELHIELYNPDSGHSWWQSFFVATPQGLVDTLREKHWRYLYARRSLSFRVTTLRRYGARW
ncbi:MAG TPA: hypothetical protein VMS18_18815 [Candidatus Binatia bacterium]|nr:hypothetical protein [Candidatus Binatia bacterium]